MNHNTFMTKLTELLTAMGSSSTIPLCNVQYQGEQISVHADLTGEPAATLMVSNTHADPNKGRRRVMAALYTQAKEILLARAESLTFQKTNSEAAITMAQEAVLACEAGVQGASTAVAAVKAQEGVLEPDEGDVK